MFTYQSVLTYVLGAQKNHHIEMVLLSTHNICFDWEIRKLIFWYAHLTQCLDHCSHHISFCFLFDLILYVPVNNSSVMSGQVFLGWTSTKQGLIGLAQGHNAVPPVRLEPATARSPVKHFTTESYLYKTKHFCHIILWTYLFYHYLYYLCRTFRSDIFPFI